MVISGAAGPPASVTRTRSNASRTNDRKKEEEPGGRQDPEACLGNAIYGRGTDISQHEAANFMVLAECRA